MEGLRHNRRRGAALMLSLWALFLLSAMVISWALDIDSRLSLSGNANRLLEAEALACSGAEVAMQPLVKPGSPALDRLITNCCEGTWRSKVSTWMNATE